MILGFLELDYLMVILINRHITHLIIVRLAKIDTMITCSCIKHFVIAAMIAKLTLLLSCLTDARNLLLFTFIAFLFDSSTALETMAAEDEHEVRASHCDNQPSASNDGISAASGHQDGDISDTQPINKDHYCKSDTLSKMGKIKRKSMQEMRLVQNTAVVVCDTYLFIYLLTYYLSRVIFFILIVK